MTFPEGGQRWLGEVFQDPFVGAGEDLLAVSKLNVRFGGVQALADVSFTIRQHDVLAVVGPNGAGKSTLLNSISGLLRDSATGEIGLAGQSMLGKSPASIAALGFGRSFQNPPLIEAETVLENVLSGAHIKLRYGLSDQLVRRRKVERMERQSVEQALAVLEFMGLGDSKMRKVSGLPYGTRKLVDIARAISSGPQLLLLDEPTSGLDAGEQEAVAHLISQLHAQTPVTILIVEHHMDVVRTVANRVLGLQSGAVLVEGTPAEVLDSVSFRTAIVGGRDADEVADVAGRVK